MMEHQTTESAAHSFALGPTGRAIVVALAAATGLALMTDSLWRSSPTYDEPMYLRLACRWWRTGDQSRITRAGSPLTFWKLQQAPVFWALDRLGYGGWIDAPRQFEHLLLPIVRGFALWIWLAAFGLVAYWSRRLYGPRAMVLASWWFAMSPNLLAHGPLVTMEIPILATMTAMTLLFWIFLQTGDRRAFVASAAVGGVAFSCKFTAVVVPPIFAILWMINRWRDGDRRPGRLVWSVTAGMAAYVAILGLADFAVTGGAVLPISQQLGTHPTFAGRLGPVAERWIGRAIETPIPQDWAGLVKQSIHQKNGTPSYLFGEVRESGWRYYYLAALAVKVPLAFWLILALRTALARQVPTAGKDWILPAAVLAFLAIASFGSTRNLGVRYVLPIAPVAVVWISGLAEAGNRVRRLAWAGLVAQALAVASIHPYELSYFNVLAGGPIGGRRILSDSNLDWAQGLKALAKLQRERPELLDLTLYYFGDTEPARYGVAGSCYTVRAANDNKHLPKTLAAPTAYLAVSASLQWGPWATPGYLQPLEGVAPLCYTDDATIAIYRTADIPGLSAPREAAVRFPVPAVAHTQDRHHLGRE
jgi:4-amino-4-deoxy-L-arabinose transferase-like glycosyltransferase